MRYIVPLICIIAAAGLQSNLPPQIAILGAKPDLVLVVLIAFSLAKEPEFGATLGFFAGLFQGAQVGQSLGSFMFTRTLTGFFAGLVTTRLFSENPIVPALSAVGLTIICETMFLLANPVYDFSRVLRTLVGESLANGIISVFVYWIIRWFSTSRKIRQAYNRARI